MLAAVRSSPRAAGTTPSADGDADYPGWVCTDLVADTTEGRRTLAAGVETPAACTGAGQAWQPVLGDATHDRTLDGVVKSYLKQKYNKPGDAYLGLVHRIDRPVSGVILFAKTSKALSRLTAAFRHREVSKTYWAVVQPAPPQEEGYVLNWLAKR